MPTVDSLDIQISAQANSASASIDKLSKKLNTLSTSLSRINGSGLSNFSGAMQTLSEGMKNLQGIKSKDFTPIAKGIQKFEKLNVGKIASIGGALQPLANGINALSSARFDNKNLQNLINSLTRLSNANLSGLANVDFTALGNSIRSLTNSLTGAQKVQQSTISITNAVANLAKSGTNIPIVTSSLPQLSIALKNFINSVAGASKVSSETITFTQAIAQLSNAGIKATATAGGLRTLAVELKKFMQIMSTAPSVSNNVIQMTNAISNLASQGGRVGTASRTLVSGLNNSTNAMNRAKKSSTSLAAAFGKFYATWFLVIRGVKKLWSSIESSMDYVETLNYFNAAFGQVADAAVSNWEEAGYDSAESYYNSFSSRAKQLTEKMTGFTITESGMLETTGGKSLGIDPNKLMQYQAMFGQMSSSMGVTSETALKLSNVLTEIGADLASVKNMDFDKVWTDMASGLAGMSRTLDKYGVNIRNVNLQQKLNELGINANIQSLNQNDKALLRTIILLDSTRYAWGDLADTIKQPANQLRLLQANFSNLARAIGNIFLPIVAKVLPYINMLVQALTRLAEWIAKLLGFEGFDWGGASGIGGIDMGSLIGDTEDEENALNKAGKAAKKLKQQLQGIDELNVTTTQDDSDSGAGSTGPGAGVSAGLEGGLDKILEEYQKTWNKAFDEMEKRSNTFADNVAKAFKQGGLYEVGKYFSTELTNALNGINWDSVYSGAKYFGTGLANFLNGLITPDLFGAVGTTIASALNTALYSLNSFGTTFDWTNFGNSIATGINNFFATFDFKALAETINVWIKGALTTASTLLKKTDFEQIGTKIGEFLRELDVLEIAGKLAEVLWEAIKSAFDLLKGLFEEAPLEASLLAAFATLKFTKLGSFIAGKISDAIVVNILGGTAGTSIGASLLSAISSSWVSLGGISGILTTDLSVIVGAGTLTEIGLTIGTGIIGAIAAAIAGWNIGQLLYEKISGEEIDMTFTEQIEEIASAFTDGTIVGAVQLMWEDIKNAIADGAVTEFTITPLVKWFTGDDTIDTEEVTDAMYHMFDDFMENSGLGEIVTALTDKEFWKSVPEVWKEIGENMFNSIKEGVGNIGEKVTETKEKISGAAKKLWTDIQGIWSVVTGWFDTKIITPISSLFFDIKENIVNYFKTAWDYVKSIWSVVSSWFNSKIKEPIVNTFKNLKDNISNAFRVAWDTAKSVWNVAVTTFTRIKTDILSVFSGKNSLKEGIIKAFKDAYSGIESAFKNIGSFFKGIANKIASPIKKALESVKSGLNWILDKVGAKQISGQINMATQFANGSSGLQKDTLGIVNDQKGSNYKELIVPPSGKPFIPEGRNVMLPLEKGTKILPADKTRKFMENMPKFKNGIGDLFGGLWSKAKSFTGDILDYITKPDEIIKIAFNKFVDTSGWNGVIKDIGTGAIKTISNSAVDFIQKIFDESGKIKYDPSKGVNQWEPVVKRALKMTNQFSNANLKATLNQMQRESGGNPKAINLWDINAKNGTPSKGLMQVIDSTFKAYAYPGYNKDIFDPLSNILASIQYTVSRYGSLYKGWTARGYKGYANGIGNIKFNDLVKGYSAGGYPEPYSLFAMNEGGKPEWLGDVGGKTGVVGNGEITGIQEAVYSTGTTEAELLSTAIGLLQVIADKEFGVDIDGRELVNAYDKRKTRNGFSFS